MAYVLQAWLPLIVWQQVEAPRYHKGYVTMIFLSATLIATPLVIRVLHKKQKLRRTRWISHNTDRPSVIANESRERAAGYASDTNGTASEQVVENR